MRLKATTVVVSGLGKKKKKFRVMICGTSNKQQTWPVHAKYWSGNRR